MFLSFDIESEEADQGGHARSTCFGLSGTELKDGKGRFNDFHLGSQEGNAIWTFNLPMIPSVSASDREHPGDHMALPLVCCCFGSSTEPLRSPPRISMRSINASPAFFAAAPPSSIESL
jgi:hypothetical protein